MHSSLRSIAVLICAIGMIVMLGCKHIPRGDVYLPERYHGFLQKFPELAPYIELDDGTAISMPQSCAKRFALVQEHLASYMQSSPPRWIVDILEHDARVGGAVEGEGEEVGDSSVGTRGAYAPSQNLLARMYLEGDGVKQDSARAFTLALNAARQGHTKAQVLVATLYKVGHGITQNPEQAFFWAREAARHGEPEAMAMLADAYRLGSGTAQDDQEAFLWTMKASEAGVLRAHVWLGLYRFAMRRIGR